MKALGLTWGVIALLVLIVVTGAGTLAIRFLFARIRELSQRTHDDCRWAVATTICGYLRTRYPGRTVECTNIPASECVYLVVHQLGPCPDPEVSVTVWGNDGIRLRFRQEKSVLYQLSQIDKLFANLDALTQVSI